MKSSASKIELKLYDELFMTDEDRKEEQKEKVEQVDIANIVDFPNHPFKILRNEDLMRVVESIQNNGVINPCLGREFDGKIQLVSGHRRKAACEFLCIQTMPVIIRDMTDEQAVITMVDANIQRETILPSEKAFAYKMKMEALKSQGKRTDLTSTQLAWKSETADLIGEKSNVSGDTVRRYIRLTNLIPQLLDKVDNKEIAISPAVELSYLSEYQQEQLLSAMDLHDCTPSLAQAIKLKELSRDFEVKTSDWIEKIMAEEKPNQVEQIKLKRNKFDKYFPKSYTNQQIENDIEKGLELLKKQRNKDRGDR